MFNVEVGNEGQVLVDIPPHMPPIDYFDWTVWSWAIQHERIPKGFEEQAPLVFALLEGVIKNGFSKVPVKVRRTHQLTDIGNEVITFGMPVEPVVRKVRTDGDRGMIVYRIKFRPKLIREEGSNG